MKNKKPCGMASICEIYKIGRGPSSSHTMGPEKACKVMKIKYPQATEFEVTLYGSLAKTGKGHRTDYAIERTFDNIPVNIIFDTGKTDLPHPNTMQIIALKDGTELGRKIVCSVGGGAIVFQGEKLKEEEIKYSDTTFRDIAEYCQKNDISLADYAREHENDNFDTYIKAVWQRMKDTVEAGLEHTGEIPGGLHLQRKAGLLYKKGRTKEFGHEKEVYMLSAYAYAASEENACGELMVTAPTCGASGVLPAVLYFKQQELGYSDEEIYDAIICAGLIGNLIKTNASISGAECGCQAEVGSACAMAAAAFAMLKGLSASQIESAAEIALEHHLGLTCDPVCGLVQIPCIERNGVAAMRAVDAVCLAEMLHEQRKISLDCVIDTMYETGKDLLGRYRETSEGGLAKLYIDMYGRENN